MHHQLSHMIIKSCDLADCFCMRPVEIDVKIVDWHAILHAVVLQKNNLAELLCIFYVQYVMACTLCVQEEAVPKKKKKKHKKSSEE